MATVTRENIGLLNDKLVVTVTKDEYLPSFEKTLKAYSKQAHVPGFRKGMVPVGMIKKMYGPGLFAEEVIRNIEKGLNEYLQAEKLEIFAQPLPLPNPDFKPSMEQPADYTFSFEVGLKPTFELTISGKTAPYYRVRVTPEMVEEEVERLRRRLGKLTEPETVSNDENVLNLTFEACNANGEVEAGTPKKENSLLVKYFKESFRPRLMGLKKGDSLVLQLGEAFDDKELNWVINDLGLKEDADAASRTYKVTLTKIGLVEKREMDEAFFQEAMPGKGITTEADFRAEIEKEIQAYWDRQSMNQLHHHLYHVLLEETPMELPEGFLKKWLMTNGEKPKSAEEVEAEFPTFRNQLRWTLITDKIIEEQQLEVHPDEIKNAFRQQVLSYFGSMDLSGGNLEWVEQFIEGQMKDRDQVESTYRRLITEKVFEWAANQVQKDEKWVSSEEFIKMNEAHQHAHH
ncbi:MAG: trigger factor [Lacibacter sp.]|jgi:trigger factor